MQRSYKQSTYSEQVLGSANKLKDSLSYHEIDDFFNDQIKKGTVSILKTYSCNYERSELKLNDSYSVMLQQGHMGIIVIIIRKKI